MASSLEHLNGQGLDLSNIDETTPDEISAYLSTRWSGRGPLYDQYAMSLMLDYGWETGIRNQFRVLRRLGFTRAQMMEIVMFGRLVAGMRGLGHVYHAIGDVLPDYADGHGNPSFPQGWTADPDAFKCGLDLSTPKLTDSDRNNLTEWYERTIGYVPKSVVFGMRWDPQVLKVDRAMWERAIKTLPKQVAPYLMLRDATLNADREALREAARPLVDLRTLSMFAAQAEAVLPVDAFAYASGGSSSEATLERNRHALRHLGIEQRVLMNVKIVDTRAYFVGMTLPSPIIVSMGGMPRFHPEGDLEMARGATRDGGMTVVAGGCGWPLETIGAAATGPLMFQLYWSGDRDWVSEKLQHVHAGGFKAFCLTVDSAAYSRRERDIVLNAEIQRRRGPLPDTQSGLTWDDVEWVRAHIPLPFGLKGIMTAQDALLALEHGVDFIWVSNHGGRQLDDGRATIDALIEIAQVVRGRVPLIVDSGFRRGTDAIKALALGATLVAFGRTVLWGLASAGADGVQKVLQLLNEELVINMKLAGRTMTSELPPDIIRRVDSSGFAVPIVGSTLARATVA